MVEPTLSLSERARHFDKQGSSRCGRGRAVAQRAADHEQARPALIALAGVATLSGLLSPPLGRIPGVTSRAFGKRARRSVSSWLEEMSPWAPAASAPRRAAWSESGADPDRPQIGASSEVKL
jgi:hypothetical protein